MSASLFYSLPCLSVEGTSISTAQLIANGFKEGRFDKRYMTQAISKFLVYNARHLQFLSVNPRIEGVDPSPALVLQSAQYIGAIPLRMPASGKQGGDLLVYPRFGKAQDAFPKLIQIMSLLDDVIRPEFAPSLPLASGAMVRPPLYYDALKYIDLFETAQRTHWQKFQVQIAIHPYPKANTNWDAYSKKSYQPDQSLRFPVVESVLSVSHPEWQMLKHVLQIAVEELNKPNTPLAIRLPGLCKADILLQKIKDIVPVMATAFTIHFHDPHVIKALKEQANVLLRQVGSTHSAWRIDVAELFERYVQYVLSKAIQALPARLQVNPRFYGRGNIPSWGLYQLEPDALVTNEHITIPVDAKYKAHYYARKLASDLLKDSHRADLHQLLAYCSFSEKTDKAGILVYPSDTYSQQSMRYTNPHTSLYNTVWLVGLPFDKDHLQNSKENLSNLLAGIIAGAA